jgi:hypothetical protein
VPWSLLRFVYATKCRYDVRSIAHLIDLLNPRDDRLLHHAQHLPFERPVPNITLERLPLKTVDQLKESSLAYHVLAEDGPPAVINQWSKISGSQTIIRVELRYRRFGFFR